MPLNKELYKLEERCLCFLPSLSMSEKKEENIPFPTDRELKPGGDTLSTRGSEVAWAYQ